MMIAAIGLIVFMLFLFYREGKKARIKKLMTQIIAKDAAFCAIIQSQHAYIKELETHQQAYIKELEQFSKLSKEKTDELISLFAQQAPVSDREVSGVIMFQKLDDARKAADKLDPDSQIAKALREILQ